MIVRSPRPADGFTVLGNNVLQDQNLSYRARGLLASILSRPDNWRTDAAQLAREGREGREAVLSTLKELEAAGYVVRSKRQITRADAEADPSLRAGRWISTTTVYDKPQPVNAQVAPETGKPDPGKPVPGNPASGKPSAGPPDAIQRTETKDCTKIFSLADATDVVDAEVVEAEELPLGVPATKPRGPSPVQVIVAAFAQAMTDAGGVPTESMRAAIGRNAKRLLNTDRLDPAVVLEAAQRAGTKRQRTIDPFLGDVRTSYDRGGSSRHDLIQGYAVRYSEASQTQIGA